MKFSQVKNISIPNGGLTDNIKFDGRTLWESFKFRYVSLGDSIAAGHSSKELDDIDGERLRFPRCFEWQYGTEGVESTEIISDTYTDRVYSKLKEAYNGNVSIVSFARSGDKHIDLYEKLTHEKVKNAVSKADLITVSIGANTLLAQIGGNTIPDFVSYGNPALIELGEIFDAGLDVLEADENTVGSYRNIFKTIADLNTKPDAKFVFSKIHYPFKYLWVDESTDENNYLDGYFGPLFWYVPNVEIDIPLVGQIDLRKFVYETEINISGLGNVSLKKITERIDNPAGNGAYSLGEWVGGYIDRLNGILEDAVKAFGDPRFIIADTPAVFNSYPDRHIRENHNYSDLVNVEIVRGQTIQDLDWAKFWDNWSVDSLYTILESILTTVLAKVIIPDIDPHPEAEGQYVMYRAFADALGWQPLTRYTITYNANNGTDDIEEQKVVGTGDVEAYATLKNSTFTPKEGYYFTGWKDSNRNSYSAGQAIPITSNITLYAQWSNVYTLTYKNTNSSNFYKDSETGYQQCYEMRINGYTVANGYGLNGDGDLGAFNDPPATIPIAYGSTIEVACTYYYTDEKYLETFPAYKSASVGIYDASGNTLANNSSIRPQGYYPYGSSGSLTYPNGDVSGVAYYKFTFTGDTTINMISKTNAPAVYNKETYWDCVITR